MGNNEFTFASFNLNLERYELNVKYSVIGPIELSKETDPRQPVYRQPSDGSGSVVFATAKFYIKSRTMGECPLNISLNQKDVENFNFIKKMLTENDTVKFSGNYRFIDFLKAFQYSYLVEDSRTMPIKDYSLKKEFSLDFMKGLNEKYVCSKNRPGDLELCYDKWLKDHDSELLMQPRARYPLIESTKQEVVFFKQFVARKDLNWLTPVDVKVDLNINDYVPINQIELFSTIFDNEKGDDLRIKF